MERHGASFAHFSLKHEKQANETLQNEQDFNHVTTRGTTNHTKNTAPIRPLIILMNPRPAHVQFARMMKNKFPKLKTQSIRNANISDFFIQREDQM